MVRQQSTKTEINILSWSDNKAPRPQSTNTIQPLRERVEDIPLLVEFLVQKFSRKLGKQIQKIPANVMKTLQKYSWPGNVRELENVIERALINTQGSNLQLAEKLMTPLAEDLAQSQKVNLGEVERDYIVRILEERHWKI